MKSTWFSLGTVAAITLGSLALNPQSAKAQATGYFCGTSKGVPATIAKTSKGAEVAMIQFKSEHFSGNGYTPERRCKEVSQRFDNLNRQGLLRLSYITTGRKNGYNIVCVAREQGAPCLSEGILFTLRQGSNPNRTLKDLMEWAKFQTEPLNETTSRPYFSIDEVLETASKNVSGSEPIEAPSVAPQSPAGNTDGGMFAP
jgi:type 1 fimbria pilin